MQAVNYYIIVEKIKVEPKKVGGLILTDKVDEDNRYIKASIVSIGNLVPKSVKEKDIIYFDRHSGHSIKLDDKRYHVIQVGDVVLVE
jgi:co-chaperonin GroES (HSP10)|tara:strand:- start:360 stop:620 length:261 start_codon:yes stop_codon:yes gene_type:complete